ncbi:MAG: PAS domain S-box protein [Bacteroidetes bacterium]|nr:PAS domain S-box protein [Bacteroidota bacterium]
MLIQKGYHLFQKWIKFESIPDVSLEEAQKNYVYNIFSVVGLLIHSFFLFVNLFLRNYGLLLFNSIQIIIAVLIISSTIQKKALRLRLWLVLLSTLVLISGALFFNNGNEYMFLCYMIAAVVIFDQDWKYLLYAFSVGASFIYIKIGQNGSLKMNDIESIRSLANMVIALLMLVWTVYFLKLFYKKFRTKLEDAKEELRKSARLYEFLSYTNDLIINSKNQDEIYSKICKMAIDTGGFRFSFIATIDEQDRSLNPVVWAGFEDGYLEMYKKGTKQQYLSGGFSTSYKVMESGQYYYSNDISTDPLTTSWKDEALKRGYRSFITLPIKVAGKISSLFILYSYRVDFFTESELKMLIRVVENIGLALTAFRSEKIRRSTEMQLFKVTQAVEQSSASVVITDTLGNIEYVNPAFTKVTGYSLIEAIGQNPKMLKTGYTKEDEYKLMWDNLTHKEGWQGIFKNKKKNGDTYWENATISPVIDKKGIITNYVAVKEDITEKRKAEEALRLSFEEKQILAERLSTILNTLPANIALLDEHGYILDANDAWKKFAIETSYQDVHFDIQRSYLKVTEHMLGISDSDRKRIIDGVEELLSQGTQEFILEYLYDRGNAKQWYRLIVTPIKAHSYIGAVVMHIDISELRRLEYERSKTKREEQKKIAQAMLAGQEQEKRAIAQELHDNVNQILVSTNLFLSLALKQPERYIERVKYSMENIQLAIGENRKLSHQLVAPDFKSMDLRSVLERLTDTMLKMAGIEVEIEDSTFNGKSLGDEQKLAIYRIAQEQCSNILKYAEAKKVSISLKEENNIFIMVISDDGKGMEPQKKTNGIGLKNIKGRLDVMNGEAKIQSAEGKGFELEVKIPISTDESNSIGESE